MGFKPRDCVARLINAMETDTEVYNQFLPCHTVTRQPPLVTVQIIDTL